MRVRIALLAIAFSIGLHAEEKLFSGLGNYHRTITTSSSQAQKYFDQGLAFLFAFNHDEAIRSFTEASKLDPKSTMIWWGLSNANGPHINNPIVDEEHQKAAWAAVMKGMAKGNHESKLEQALMQATQKRFSAKPVTDRASLDKAYAKAMRKIWQDNPNDPDIAAFFAESMMDLRPWDFYKQDGTPQEGTDEILAALRVGLKLAPKHPQLIHLLIHAVEASLHPEEAIEAADRLRDLQPALGHMVHMPSHIDVRTGHWKKAVESNEKAIAADAAYRKIRPVQGFYRVYMIHNDHMLGFAAMMSGQSKKAIAAMDALVENIPKDWAKAMAPVVDGYMAMPLEARIRFGKWDEVLAAPDFPDYFPASRALRRAARSIAYSAKGKIEEARVEREEFTHAKAKVPKDATYGLNKMAKILALAEHLMNGEFRVAERKIEAAIAELKAAVRIEDSLNYSEPPDWVQPVRHTLGALLLSAGRHDQAIEVYSEDLKRLPDNVWSLYGLAQAYEKHGEKQKAAEFKARFEKVSQENQSDVKIDTSCLCIRPGKILP